MGLALRAYSDLEQAVDRYLHWAGLAVAVAAGTLLVVVASVSGKPVVWLSVALYVAGLLAMLTCSAMANHFLHDRSPRSRWLERLDHSAIFFMIAATYSPFAIGAMGGAWGWRLFLFVWSVALLGIGVKLLTRGGLSYRWSISLYLVLGWSILPVLQPLLSAVSTAALALLLAGGLLYSTGVLFFVWSRLPFHHVVWHGFVLAAAGLHYAAVLVGVVLPAAALPSS
ncbi:hemolysin III [Natronocella acetinitrilica]|uniref:Hemolysin III n=1 Tax=Natronocella acetinitrilica TaxID=414046 RepID=A0AAE3G6W6_9GAMM|nr:hemolysin III family protein [Natronocella acetinitrilica]MCP1676975.1 hemolysin III [Natronocella acetinitrilica]